MSTERVGHADKARRSLAFIEQRVMASEQASAHAAVAQAHATLALVEQQRIANLIALGQYRVKPGDLPIFRHLVIEPTEYDSARPAAVIREGLGL